MELAPRLIDVVVPARPSGAVFVLHGGASRRESMMVSPTQLSVLRMIPIARRIARGSGRELAVFRVLNSRRGWDTHHTPVADAEWAMRTAAERLGSTLPTCLVGHSLGGRAALLAAGHAGVESVVALAPWVLPSDAPRGLDGQRVLVVHGDRDRIARPDRSAALAERMRGHARISYVTVAGGKHAMLSHHRTFDGLAADFAVATLLDREPRTDPVRRALAGEGRTDA